jgi:hypothetical protein
MDLMLLNMSADLLQKGKGFFNMFMALKDPVDCHL